MFFVIMFYLATIFDYLSGYLLAHFLQCFQFNTHMIESVYSNRVIAPDAETRMWKDARYININNIGLIIFWIKLISSFSSISKISLKKTFLFQIFSDWRVRRKSSCRWRNIPNDGERQSFM